MILEVTFITETPQIFTIESTPTGYKTSTGKILTIEELSNELSEYVESILNLLPYAIIFQYYDNDEIFLYHSFDLFGYNQIEDFMKSATPLSEKDVQTKIKFKIEEQTPVFYKIIELFPFIEKYVDNIFDGHFLINWYCPNGCNTPIFFDISHDAMLCLKCDKWLEKPLVYEEDKNPAKPSDREQLDPRDKHRSTINSESQVFYFSFNTRHEGPYKYSITPKGSSHFEIKNLENQETQAVNSISSMKNVILSIIETDIKKITYFRFNSENRIQHMTLHTSSLPKKKTVETIFSKVFPYICDRIIADRYWINPN